MLDVNLEIPAVEVCDLTIGYGDRVILQHLNFTLKKGDITAILGGSGSGKSTLLKHLIGLYRPLQGIVKIEGVVFNPADEDVRLSIYKKIGVAYQGGALLRSLTVFENTAFPLQEKTTLTSEQIREKVMQKLQMVQMETFADYYPADLSGGMIKRAAIARAMALDPSILFLDEPSAGLDPVSSAQLDQLILSVRNEHNTTVVLVTHELPSIFTVADRVLMIDSREKGIAADGNPVSLRKYSNNQWVHDFLNRQIPSENEVTAKTRED